MGRGGHNKLNFWASYNFIGKMGGWEIGGGVQTLSTEQGVLWHKIIFWGFFCVKDCEGVFFDGQKSNVAKHSITLPCLFIGWSNFSF